MKLKTYNAPHIRHHETTRVLMGDAIITMLFLYAMAYYYYGLRAVMIGLVSVASAWITDAVCNLVARRKINIMDFSSIVTGLLLPLLLPVTIDYYIVVAAAVFAMLVAKHPFGGTGNNVFNPAAAGCSFVVICFADKLFSYPLPMYKPPVFGSLADVVTVNSPAFTLGLGGMPKYDLVEMALGNFPGPMGATNILLLTTCLLFLIFRGTVRWEGPVFFFLFAAITSYLMRWLPLAANAGEALAFTLYDMMSGILLIGGVYLLGDPVTIPKRVLPKAVFSAATGVVVILFRVYGGLEEGLPFAVLLMNATVWGFDMLGERLAGVLRRGRAQ